jgi:hypothetical protein
VPPDSRCVRFHEKGPGSCPGSLDLGKQVKVRVSGPETFWL